MGYYIIIRGPLGIGKSTVARKLAQEVNGKHISIDAILTELGLDKVDEAAGCIPVESFIKANELALPEARQHLSKGKVVVFDGNFYHKEQIEHLINGLNTEHYVFTLTADVDVCIKRDRERESGCGEVAARAVHKLVSRFDYGTVIDTSNETASQTVSNLISFLPK